MYQLIGIIGAGKDQAHYSQPGNLLPLLRHARQLAARWGDLLHVRIYRFDGTNIATRARRVPLH